MSDYNVTIKTPKNAKKAKKGPVIKVGGGKSTEYREWYLNDKTDVGSSIVQIINNIDNQNTEQTQTFQRFAQLYGNAEALGWANLGNAYTEATTNRPVFNVVQSSIDTVNSKIAKDNPKPTFTTAGSEDYYDKLKAEKMTQFIQGLWQECDFYEIANNDVFRDGCLYGLGGVECYLDKNTNKVKYDWVFIDEIKVDRYDGATRQPRSMHRVKLYPKEVVIDMYPDKEEEINDLFTSYPSYFRTTESVIDMILLTRSWHLNSRTQKGRYVVTIADLVLEDDNYDEDYFPFEFFRYYNKPAMFYGRGIAEAILSGQIEINKILLFIQQCQELQASPVILVDNASQVAEDVLLSNNIARMIPYRSGTEKPTFLSPPATNAEIYDHLKWWIASCYQEVGISQTSASGQKQAGIDSAIAMRTMVDIESSRFIQVSKKWERFFVGAAQLGIKVAKKAYENDPEFSVKYTDKKSNIIKEIKWKKINLPDDMYRIQCDTISGFPSSTSGRIATVTDIFSQGGIGREKYLELVGRDPDLEAEIRLQTSTLNLTEKALCDMVEDNIYTHPTKYMDCKLSLKLSVQTYNLLQLDGCPDSALQLVRNWIDELCVLITGQDPNVQLIQSLFAGPGAPGTAAQNPATPAAAGAQQAA